MIQRRFLSGANVAVGKGTFRRELFWDNLTGDWHGFMNYLLVASFLVVCKKKHTSVQLGPRRIG